MASELKKKIEQNRKNGQKGGQRVAEIHGAQFCEERARQGGNTCLMRYGKNFYRSIRMMRTA